MQRGNPTTRSISWVRLPVMRPETDVFRVVKKKESWDGHPPFVAQAWSSALRGLLFLIYTYITTYQVEVQVVRSVPVRGQLYCPPLPRIPAPVPCLCGLVFCGEDTQTLGFTFLLVTSECLSSLYRAILFAQRNMESSPSGRLLRNKDLASMKLKHARLYT